VDADASLHFAAWTFSFGRPRWILDLSSRFDGIRSAPAKMRASSRSSSSVATPRSISRKSYLAAAHLQRGSSERLRELPSFLHRPSLSRFLITSRIPRISRTRQASRPRDLTLSSNERVFRISRCLCTRGRSSSRSQRPSTRISIVVIFIHPIHPMADSR